MKTKTHHRDTESTEGAQRQIGSARGSTFAQSSVQPPCPLCLCGELNKRRRSTHRSFTIFKLALATSLLFASFNFNTRDATRAQVRPIYDQGAVALGLALRRLQTTASVLHIGAHPDDEDSALIAELARHEGARVAYLSLNRGEGGQNRIGAELFDALGVIRTEELLQARRLDGGQQFFARTFDFGFTKTLAEAQQRWDERAVLADMVRVIRTFRPLVIVSRWQGTPADGHGQHQFSGYLAPKAFRAAADPDQFPEQIAEGLRPWQARKFYVSANPNAATRTSITNATPNNSNANVATDTNVARIETGDYDPLLGRSAYELAMEGRSQHKSQGETALELKGEQASGARLVESVSGSSLPGMRSQSLFDGVDTSIGEIDQIAGLRVDGMIGADLKQIQRDAETALEKFDASDSRAVLPALVAGLAHTRALIARERDRRGDNPQNRDLASQRSEVIFLLEQKEREFSDALRYAAGARVDALADTETVARGDAFNVVVRAYAPEELKGRVKSVRLRAPDGWRVEELSAAQVGNAAQAFGRERATGESYFRVSVPETAEFTQPYWLKHERKGDLYEWDKGDAQTLPFAPAPVVAEVEIDAGETFTIEQPVEFRLLDSVRGEVRRELNVVPEVDVRLTPALVVVPRERATREGSAVEFTVQLTNNVRRTTEAQGQPVARGFVTLTLPAGWREPAPAEFRFDERSQRATVKFSVRVPASVAPGAYQVSANAATTLPARPLPGVERAFGYGERALSYPHIQTHRYYVAADATVRAFDLKVENVRVGYVMGSGDEVPAAIERMGLKVTMLTEDDLAAGDLSRFDTIVVGIRASQSRPDFVANNKRLLDFVSRGGTLIVQYQRPDYAQRNLAPYPATMETRGANGQTDISRVVDETAPVRVLERAHPVFNFPNKITDEDFRGWVQERDLYNFITFDARYTPLLESHDANEPASNGGMVFAHIGRGAYVYTSYAFFRQLPAGVPGAYRLFANLLGLPKATDANARTKR